MALKMTRRDPCLSPNSGHENDEHILRSFSFNIYILNIRIPDVQFVEISKERHDMQYLEGCNSGLYTIHRNICKMPDGDAPCLMSNIILGVKNKVYLDLFVTCWWTIFLAIIDEVIVPIKLVYFNLSKILSLGCTVRQIQCIGIYIIPWIFISILKCWDCAE